VKIVKIVRFPVAGMRALENRLLLRRGEVRLDRAA
jgi:hypothetical protein